MTLKKKAGYSHGWMYSERADGTTGFTEQEFLKILRATHKIIAAAEADGIAIRGPHGTGKPVITERGIQLNGDASTRQEYESFALYPNKEGWDFCKTNHLPYDAVVVSILAVAKRVAPKAIHIQSDGGPRAIKRVYSQKEATVVDDKALRSQLIRLAHAKPELRSHLLPLLKAAAEIRIANRSRYIPQGVPPVPVPPESEVEAWIEDKGRLTSVVAFAGKSNKPVIYTLFRSRAMAEKALADLVDRRMEMWREKEEAKTAVNPYQVGDIVYSSWGYDQTNVNFYRIVRVTDRTVSMQEIGRKPVTQNSVTADPSVKNPKITNHRLDMRGVKPGEYPRINISSYRSAYHWDGKPQYQTPAGLGH